MKQGRSSCFGFPLTSVIRYSIDRMGQVRTHHTAVYFSGVNAVLERCQYLAAVSGKYTDSSSSCRIWGAQMKSQRKPAVYWNFYIRSHAVYDVVTSAVPCRALRC